MRQELCFAFLHRNRIDDALALNALQPGFDHAPFGGIKHDGHPRDVRLGSHQLEEFVHGGERIQHRLVHVDINHLRAVFHLLPRHCQSIVETALQNHAGKGFGARDIGPLADVDIQRVGSDVKGFQTGQAQGRRNLWRHARRQGGHPLRDLADMLRRGAAAATDNIDDTLRRPVGDFSRQLLRRLVVTAKGIG